MGKSSKQINAELPPIDEIDVEEAFYKLPLRVQSFIQAYFGDAGRAAQLSGISRGYAYNLLTRNDVKAIIRSRVHLSGVMDPLIATREERQRYWTQQMHNMNLSPAERLKASELLGKSFCDFAERKVIEGGDNPLQHQISVSVKDRIKQLQLNSTKTLTNEDLGV